MDTDNRLLFVTPNKFDVFFKLTFVVPNKLDVFAKFTIVTPNKFDVFVKFTIVTPNKFDVFAKEEFVVYSKFLVLLRSVPNTLLTFTKLAFVVVKRSETPDNWLFVLHKVVLRFINETLFKTSLLDRMAAQELYATVLTLVSLLMFCVNRSLSTQANVERFVKAAGSEVRAHAVVLRFQKFKLKLTTEVLIFVMSLLRWNRLDIEVFALTIEELMWANALLNEELSVPSDPSVFETLHYDVLMIAMELKRDVSFEIKVVHKFDTFTQQALE